MFCGFEFVDSWDDDLEIFVRPVAVLPQKNIYFVVPVEGEVEFIYLMILIASEADALQTCRACQIHDLPPPQITRFVVVFSPVLG